ncbi:MAG: HAD family hydrolase [Lachnospiraceae bacterium]|nr:HAD family hydrolase [Lachnospiraceae bacterium]
MKTLYVTDLDGTLLNTNSRINPYSLDVINNLVDKGMLFTYATARSLVSASVVAQGLATNIPIIAYNGAFIINPSTNEILSSSYFHKDETEKIIKVLSRFNISPLVYSYVDGSEKVSWITEKENEGIRYYLDTRKGDPRFRPLADSSSLYAGDIFYITCIGEREELLPVYEIFSQDDRYTCSFHQELYRPEYWCEILPKKATKAEAIQNLKKLWNCDRVVSFGDAVNDIPMFRISDECYAVSNAVDELKELATGIIESNDEDGVAKWLQEHVFAR